MRSAIIVTAVLTPLVAAACTTTPKKAQEKLNYAAGGTFTTSITADPGNLDPLLTTDQNANRLGSYAYDTLINLDAKGNPVPQLATHWDVTPSSVVFTLRKGVTCADGSALTAKQVAANFDFIKNPKNQSTLVGYNLPDANFTARADDAAGTVKITLAKPYGFLLTGAGTVPIVCAKGTANRKLLAHGTDGTGPFRLVEAVPNDHYTFAVRKDYRWGPNGARASVPGFPDKLVFKVVQSDTTADNLLLNGQLNAVDVIGVDRERLLRQGLFVEKVPGSQLNLLFNQRSSSPTSDPAVRKALTMGLDLAQLITVLTEKNGTAPDDLEPNPPKPCPSRTVPGTLPAHDADTAKAALDAAGWTAGGGGVRTKDGKKLTMRLLYPGGTPATDSGMELVASWWKSLGVSVKPVSRDANAVQQELFSTGGWDAVLLNIGVSNPSQLVGLLSGPVPPDGQNFAAIKNSEYSRLSAQAIGVPGKPGCDLWALAEKSLLRDLDIVPISVSTVYTFGNKARFTNGIWGLEPTSLRLLAG